MPNLENEADPDILMETGVIYNPLALSKSLGHGRVALGIGMANLLYHLANKKGAVEALHSVQNRRTQK